MSNVREPKAWESCLRLFRIWSYYKFNGFLGKPNKKINYMTCNSVRIHLSTISGQIPSVIQAIQGDIKLVAGQTLLP